MPFEILHGALVLLGGGAAVEGAEIAAAAGLRIYLARIEPVFAGRQFADHWRVLGNAPPPNIMAARHYNCGQGSFVLARTSRASDVKQRILFASSPACGDEGRRAHPIQSETFRAVAEQLFAARLRQIKGSGTPADAVVHDLYASGAQGAPRRRRLAPPFRFGRARLPAFHHGTCGSDRTPPLSSSSRTSWDGATEERVLSVPCRPSAAGDVARRPVVVPAGRFYPEPPGSGADNPARGNRTRPYPPASPGGVPSGRDLICSECTYIGDKCQ